MNIVENLLQQISDKFLDISYLQVLWDGFLVTFAISILTIFFSTIIGFILAMISQSRHRSIQYLVYCYNAIFRYSPLLPQLFFWYFGVGSLLPVDLKLWFFSEPQIQLGFLTVKIPSFEFVMGLIGLVFYSSAFITEEFQSGILGVKAGQLNASLALGLTRIQSLRYVILPQALQIAFLPLIGQYMNIIKNSSLTMSIGVLELSYMSRQLETNSLKTFQAFATTTGLYILAVILIGTVGNVYYQRLLRNRGQILSKKGLV